MFKELILKYSDFCWFEVTDKRLRTTLEDQADKEIRYGSPLYSIKRKLKALAKSGRQDDVLFSDGEKFYVIHLAWNNGTGSVPRFKALAPEDLIGYMEWYYLNV